MLDIGAAREDAFKVDPLPLNIDPDIEQNVDTVEFLFPGCSVFFEY